MRFGKHLWMTFFKGALSPKVDMAAIFARTFLLGFLSFTVASLPAAAGEFDGSWRGTGRTTSEQSGWSCPTKFGFRFEITGNKVRGDLRGSVDANGRIKATSKWSSVRPFHFQGTIRDSTVTGNWKVIRTCRGTWEARRLQPVRRLYPPGTIFPEKIAGVEIREVVFTTGVERAQPVDSLDHISINAGSVYILVKWQIDLDIINSFTVTYEGFDGKGGLLFSRSGFFAPNFVVPTSSRWNTWKSIPIRPYNEAGEWRFVVYFNDQRAIETKLTVSP